MSVYYIDDAPRRQQSTTRDGIYMTTRSTKPKDWIKLKTSTTRIWASWRFRSMQKYCFRWEHKLNKNNFSNSLSMRRSRCKAIIWVRTGCATIHTHKHTHSLSADQAWPTCAKPSCQWLIPTFTSWTTRSRSKTSSELCRTIDFSL